MIPLALLSRILLPSSSYTILPYLFDRNRTKYIMGAYAAIQSLPGYIKYTILILLALQLSVFAVWMYMLRGEVAIDRKRKLVKVD